MLQLRTYKKFPVPFVRRSLSSVGDNGAGNGSKDAKETMKNFIQQNQGSSQSLWTRLKKDTAPIVGASSTGTQQRIPPSGSKPRANFGPSSSDRMRSARPMAARPANPNGPASNRGPMNGGGPNNSGSGESNSFEPKRPSYGDRYGNVSDKPAVGRTRRIGFGSSGVDDEDAEGRSRAFDDEDGGYDDEDMYDEYGEKRVKKDKEDVWLDADDEGEDLDDDDKALVFDTRRWEESVREGYTIHTSHMDVLDQFMATAFIESMKTKDDSFLYVDEPTRITSVPLPQPRTMHQLLYAMEPNVRCSELGTAGHQLGENAWNVINKNIYYSEEQKYTLADTIAETRIQVEKFAAETRPNLTVVDSPYPAVSYDGIFRFGFRKGLRGINHEKKLRDEAVFVAPADQYAQGETDWSVQAVANEDEL